MRRAIVRDLVPSVHLGNIAGGNFSGAVGETIDDRVVAGLPSLPTVDRAPWAFLSDVSGLIETKSNNEVKGGDGLHWMCNYRLTIYDKKFAVDGDNTGCHGDVDGAFLLHLMSMALAMATEPSP